MPLEEEVVAERDGREPDVAKVAGQALERARRTKGDPAFFILSFFLSLSTPAAL